MNLTPIDVEQKAFTQALRGYQMDEVDDFLDEVVTTLRGYEQRLRDAQEKIRALEVEVSNRGGDEGAISRAFVAAQRSADAMVAEAEAEAEKIRQRALAESDELAAKRDAERQVVLGEIAGMRERMLALRVRLGELTSAIGTDIGQMDSELSGAESDVTGEEPIPSIDEASERGSSEPLRSLELDEDADLDEPSLVEESASRVSARPWERG
jgi:cell division initiation protein